MSYEFRMPNFAPYLRRFGLMKDNEHLLENMKIQFGTTCTIFLITVGIWADYTIISDGVGLGKIGSFVANFLTFIYIPCCLLSLLINFFLVGNLDPGYLGNKHVSKRMKNDTDIEEGGDLIDKSNDKQEGQRGQSVTRHLYRDLNSDYYDYCEECDVNLPMDRSIGHCYTCNACIQDMDHHCPWIGSCVGKNNEKHFWRFNMSWAMLMFQLLLTAIFG
jgi:hypothetical protein